MRWYRSPAILHKIYPTVPNTCWRCLKEVGTMTHIWWSCPTLTPFWKKVHSISTSVSSLPLVFDPTQYLLHALHASPLPQYGKSLAMFMVAAARMCIPVHWKATRCPTVREWFNHIQKVCDMEEIIHTSQDTYQKFCAVWLRWLLFRGSQAYSENMR